MITISPSPVRFGRKLIGAYRPSKRLPGFAVARVEVEVVGHEPDERILGGHGQHERGAPHRIRRPGQGGRRIGSIGTGGAQQVAGNDPEITAAPAGMGPPQIPVLSVPGRGDQADAAVARHGHHFHAVQMIRHHAVFA
ncbi:hypothetical protein [Nocardia testacea]|uniref:hypothetical protein n=1 Tax=Nocardia testacea TaxID=248551 RepID=UPI001FE0E643|nr:hypothetical protein [Nocardia testacea]